MANKDYYEILGIKNDASNDDIKKAFRSLAAKYHPDKKTGDEAKFKEISEAYAVLGDEKRKAEYDTYGHAFSGGRGAGFNGFGGGGGGFNWQDFQEAAGGQHFEFDLGDIFQNFGFGGDGRQEVRGRDISIDIELSFQDAVFGVTRSVLLTKNNTCDKCKGTGAKDGSELVSCTVCNGNGRIRETRQSILGSFQTVKECSTCHGSGKMPKEKCGHCAGSGIARSEDEIEVVIPAGIQNGEMIRMTGRGEAVAGGTPGDLYIKIHVAPHETIRREGNNLVSTLPIKLSDALLGGLYNVETLDGISEIKVPAGVTHGESLRIKGKGVEQGGRRGDFLVKISIETPSKLSRKAQKMVEELRKEGI